MDDLKPKARREPLKYVIIFLCILSGSFVDIIKEFIVIDKETYGLIHLSIQDLKLLGLALFGFKATPYQTLKLKSASFVFVLWSSSVLIYNVLSPNFPFYTIIIPLYALYLVWLIRISLIKKKTTIHTSTMLRTAELADVPYNVFLPASTFRGLLQILFLWHKNPIYETRLLVARGAIIGIRNKRFARKIYSRELIEEFIANGAKIKACKNYSHDKVTKLLNQKASLIFNNCTRLEM